jgi:hypothetical protein
MFTRATQCVRDVLNPPVSVFSLSLYRHPFLYTLFSSRFTLIINNNNTHPSHSQTSREGLGTPGGVWIFVYYKTKSES